MGAPRRILKIANFQFTEFLWNKEGFPFVEIIEILGASKSVSREIERGRMIGEERQMPVGDLPKSSDGDVTPKTLAIRQGVEQGKICW